VRALRLLPPEPLARPLDQRSDGRHARYACVTTMLTATRFSDPVAISRLLGCGSWGHAPTWATCVLLLLDDDKLMTEQLPLVFLFVSPHVNIVSSFRILSAGRLEDWNHHFQVSTKSDAPPCIIVSVWLSSVKLFKCGFVILKASSVPKTTCSYFMVLLQSDVYCIRAHHTKLPSTVGNYRHKMFISY
jgi:hypothetical protein